jgi:hypothetical protein
MRLDDCKDRQNVTFIMEYRFPKWFASMKLKLFLTYLPRAVPQISAVIDKKSVR